MPAIVFEESYIYIFGGYEGSGRIDSIEQYDISNDQWSVLPVRIPISVEAETATLISSNEVIILGGHDHIYETAVDENTGTFIVKSGCDFEEFSDIELVFDV